MPVIPPPPQTQALTCKTFRPPVLDGSLTLQEIFDWHATNNANHRLFVYARDDGSVRTIYWPEAVTAMLNGALIIRKFTNWSFDAPLPVVAILAPADTITYFTLQMAIMRANCIPFPISPRNAAGAVAHLIGKVKCKFLLVGREQSMIDLAANALRMLKEQNSDIQLPSTMPIPLFEDFYITDTPAKFEDVPFKRPRPDETVFYLHSSGSTAYPKPIPWTSHRFIQLSLIPWFGGRDLTDQVFSLHVMPMFHGMGILQLPWTASCGLVVGAFEPKSPATIPTPDSLFVAAKASNADVLFCVPSFIEDWARKPSYVTWLATRNGVLFGGGPLNKEAGNHLTSQGVNIFILYGSTEGGIMSPILPAKVDYDWDHFEFPGLVTPHMAPQGDGTFEFVMVENIYCRPSVINTKIDGIDAYATSDLFVPHPTRTGFWRVHGRTDDQIMHNTGEKTNPGPLENLLNQNPRVLSSVMFGRGRFQAGVVIDLRPEFKFDPEDDKLLADARNHIWPTVEKLNEFAPQHSRLFKEMILFSQPSKPFTYTAKNTARRQAIIDDYDDEINKAYDDLEESTQANIPLPNAWNPPSTTTFVREVVCQALKKTLPSDDVDLFQYGCDSLQATWIRNSILRAIRTSAQLDTRETTRNFVYDYPTIRGLAEYVGALLSGKDAKLTDEISVERRVKAMEALAAKYSAGLGGKASSELVPSGTGDIVIVTGTTGALGSHLLSTLALDKSVSRVYALNRRSTESTLRTRQEAALQLYDLTILSAQSKVVLLEADFSVANFGLEQAQFNELQTSVTHIIHNAWRVDFNLALASFEANVQSVRALLDFACGSPRQVKPRFTFVSSVGVFQNPTNDVILSGEAAIDAAAAVGTGYSESKWVAERILKDANDAAGIEVFVVRVGQLAGAANGVWSRKEWFPSLVQASAFLGYLPSFGQDKLVSWLPVQTAADAIVDLCHVSHNGKIRFAHLIHPHPASWNGIAATISSSLDLKPILFKEWFNLLESASLANDRPKALNAWHLLPYLRGLGLKDEASNEAFNFPSLANENMASLSKTLARLPDPAFDQEAVQKWLAYWKREGLFNV